MEDATSTLADVRRLVAEFVDERDWHQFHAPKNLAMAMSIEVAELMEHFQWLTVEASRQVADDAVAKQAVSEELADVICYALAMANEMDIDVAAAMSAKMVKNREKYPADRYQGRYE